MNKKRRIGEKRELGIICTYAFRRPEKEREDSKRTETETERFPSNAKRLDHFLSAGLPFRLGTRNSQIKTRGRRDSRLEFNDALSRE
jgi:hypothetical protein